MGKPEGKSLLRRPRHRWEDSIKLYLNIIKWESIKGINMAQWKDRYWAVVCMIMNLQIPENTGNVLES